MHYGEKRSGKCLLSMINNLLHKLQLIASKQILTSND